MSRNRALAYGTAVLVLLAVGGRFLLDSGTARRGDARAASSSACFMTWLTWLVTRWADSSAVAIRVTAGSTAESISW